MKHVKLVQMDGKLPNLALMKLAHRHLGQGDEVTLSRFVQRTLFEREEFDLVYASAIFSHSATRLEELRGVHPDAIGGGTGAGGDLSLTVEQVLGIDEYERYDYSIYPEYPWSLGFTQRGCPLNCGFCVVPRKEGRPRAVNSIMNIWRPQTERCILLLDNDFFGQPKEQWQARVDEIREGRFKVNFSQGINVRLINDEAAQALASMRYYDGRFTRRRLYTAWDNLGQEKIFFQGVDRLEAAGIPPRHLMVYMLVGYAPGETMEQVLHRHRRLEERGCRAFPMVYGENRELKDFQRWVVRRYSEFIPWQDYRKTSQ